MISVEEKAIELINTFGKDLALKVTREIIDTVLGGDWSSPVLDYWEEVENKIKNYD